MIVRRPTVADAFDVARDRFYKGLRIDMQSIAEDLGISRVTLYRWVGSRESLITEVLWTSTLERFKRYEGAKHDGARSAHALISFVRDVNCGAFMQRFLREEPEFALGLLTGAGSTYQQRYIALVTDLIAKDRMAGYVSQEIPLEDLAFTAVRVTQSYIHTHALIGQEPDAGGAASVLRVLLR